MFRFDRRIYTTGSRTFIKGFVILLLILAIGTVGYMRIEKWNMLDALYMTVITITTVGYREVKTVSQEGMVFTIFIIFGGMGIMAYILGLVAQAMVDIKIRSIIGRTKLGLKMRSIKNHYIICGFGRIGKIIGREFKLNKLPMVVVDHDLSTKEMLEDDDIPYLNADATSEEVLIEAGIEKARVAGRQVIRDEDIPEKKWKTMALSY